MSTDKSPKKSNKFNNFINEFKEFINRGNVVDLAVGVAVGGAFTAIVNSLVNDIIMPITSLLAGGLNFKSLAIDIPNVFGADSTAHIAYGNFIQNVVNFLIVAFAIFIVVKMMNKLNRSKDAAIKKAEEEAEKLKEAKDKVKELKKSESSQSKTTTK